MSATNGHPGTGLVHVGDAASLIAQAEMGQPRASLHERLDPVVFAYWMGLLGDRMGRRLEKATVDVYRVELARRLDTAQFVAGARTLFGRPLYAQWPGPEQFAEALTPAAPSYGYPNAAETARYLDQQRAEAVAVARDRDRRDATLDQFHADWRAALADALPEKARPRGYGRPEDEHWLRDATPLVAPTRAGTILRALARAGSAPSPEYPEPEAVDAAVARSIRRTA
jgi:hypothetical protein